MTPLEFLKSKGIKQGITTWHSEDICELLTEYAMLEGTNHCILVKEMIEVSAKVVREIFKDLNNKKDE